MPSAGDLNRRLRFERRGEMEDPFGNVQGEWQAAFTVSAAVLPLKGGEHVMAGRLSGTQPVVLQIRRSSQSQLIRADWRAVDAHSGEVFALTSPPVDMKGDRAFLDILATIGVGA